MDASRLWSDTKRKLKDAERRSVVDLVARLIERRKGNYPEGLISQGIAFAALGQIDNGVAALERAMVLGTDSVERHAGLELAKILYEQNQNLPRAVDLLRETTRGEEADPIASFYLGQSIRRLASQDYPPRHGGDDEGRLIGIGYISSHSAHESDDPSTVPVSVTIADLEGLLAPALSNTEFQLRLREILLRAGRKTR